jgi:hypothetical protein
MRIYKFWFMTSLLAFLMAGCGSSNNGSSTAGDTTAPTVSSTNPGDTSTGGVAPNGKLTVTFSEAMDPATCTAATFTLKQGLTAVPGAVSCVGRTATFAPTSNLAASTAYSATATTGFKDMADNAMAANKSWSFTTGATADATAPTVSSTDPADTAAGVVVNRNITAAFSEAIDPATITALSFTLKQGATPVSGSVTSMGSVATLDPTSNLTASTLYTATITTAAKDLAGNALAVSKTWTFTTGTGAGASAGGPASVSLGTAAGFAILTKTGVTDVPASVITGDVGASPITGAALGVTCAEVTGTMHAVDAAGPLTCTVTDPSFLTTAVSDMELAYADAAGRTVPAPVTELGAGDISAMTLAPDLYKWGTGLNIDNRGVTLQGGANDVWIFQIAQNLTVANTAIVTLSGGAQAKNVFWQVAGQANLGTTSAFKGTLLSKTQIVLQTNSTIIGRALAQTQVTLDHTTVTTP